MLANIIQFCRQQQTDFYVGLTVALIVIGAAFISPLDEPTATLIGAILVGLIMALATVLIIKEVIIKSAFQSRSVDENSYLKMNKFLLVIAFIFALGVSLIYPPVGIIAAAATAALTALVVALIKRTVTEKDDTEFLVAVFIGALMTRVLLATTIYLFNLQPYFGPDALGYDEIGMIVADCWSGAPSCVYGYTLLGDNRGLNYFVAVVYFIFGQNPLLMQFLSAIAGSLTAIPIYYCALSIFDNRRVAKYAALFVAFFPGLIIWSSQLLKDGFVLLLLVVIFSSVIQLQKKLSYLHIALILLSLLMVAGLRFYIFYMVALAAIGAFLLGSKISLQDMTRRFIVLTLLGVGLLALGGFRSATEQLGKADLKEVEKARRSAANGRIAGSGFNEDADVSTASGALAALPMGVATILFAPFPWQMQKLTQLLTFPEMVIWWGSIPLIFIGLRYTLRNRLRESVSVLFFTVILLLSYSIYQGNLGTMYRQRTQIQVFLLMFAAVGYVVQIEKRENSRLLARHKTRTAEERHQLAILTRRSITAEIEQDETEQDEIK